MPLFTQGHALLIGVGGDLPYTITDVRGLGDVLQDPERCAYPPQQVRRLCGDQAPRAAILAALDEQAARATAADTLLVYFSGHGYRDPNAGGRFYLLPHGYQLDDLPGSAVSGAEFSARLAALPAQKLLILLDCCHAGALGGSALEQGKAPLPPEALDLLRQGRGRALIASSLESERSFAGWPYSAFTLALVEALCGRGNAQNDGLVRLADLAMHARQVVPLRTTERQHPILHFEQADNFVVAYYAAGSVQSKGLPFNATPQIEPQPGAWAGQTIQTGGGPYIAGNFSGNYAAGNQTVIGRLEDRSVHVHAPLNGSTIITGAGNQVNSAPSREDFDALLRQAQALLPQTALPPAQAAELHADLAVVQEQAAQPAPSRAVILKRLSGVVEFLANSATLLTAAPQLLEMGRRALEWAKLLFP